MPRDDVMSTPIFDELLREMAQRAEADGQASPAEESAAPDTSTPPRRRHRAE